MLSYNLIGNKILRKKLLQSAAAGKIAHAQLFTGEEGVGKLAFAIEYAAEILPNDKKESSVIQNVQHPDLHFVFPVTTNSKVKSKPVSDLFLKQWYHFLSENIYGSLFDWYQHIGIENKQGQIGVYEAEKIIKKLSLKSYQGGYKIVIIWGAEKLNSAASNKLLKIIEEPPEKTVFILIADKEEQLLQTIRSRVQSVYFKKIEEEEIAKKLTIDLAMEADKAREVAFAAQGNYNRALKLSHQAADNEFEPYFISWIRWAFMAKSRPQVLKNLVEWANEISSWGREKQKRFLDYTLQIFRQAMLTNYGLNPMVFKKINAQNFHWQKFSFYIHGANIESILNELNQSFYQIERNANAKIIFLDLSIKITRFLHLKIKE